MLPIARGIPSCDTKGTKGTLNSCPAALVKRRAAWTILVLPSFIVLSIVAISGSPQDHGTVCGAEDCQRRPLTDTSDTGNQAPAAAWFVG